MSISSNYSIGIEAVGRKYRIVCGFIYQILFALGSACLGLVAYFVRDWRVLQFVISVPMFGLTALYWLNSYFITTATNAYYNFIRLIFRVVPESIGWLITKKHYPEVRKLVLRAADLNGTQIPESMFTSFGEVHESNQEIGVSQS